MTAVTQGGSSSIRSDVLERVTDGVVALDAALRYTYVNRRAETILGKTSDELLGNTVWEIFPETASTEARTHIETALETQEEHSYERYNPQLECWFHVRLYPDDGGLTVLFTDETERKALEAERDRTNAQLTALVENTSECIYIKDLDGTYQLANSAAAAIFGLTPADVVAAIRSQNVQAAVGRIGAQPISSAAVSSSTFACTRKVCSACWHVSNRS